MQLLKNPLLLVIGVTSFVFTFVSIGKLSFFLSSPLKIGIKVLATSNEINKIVTNIHLYIHIFNALFIDSSLAILFVLSHSFLKLNWIKNLWERIGLKNASRSIYNLLSGLTLLVSIYWTDLTTFTDHDCILTVATEILEGYSICLVGIQPWFWSLVLDLCSHPFHFMDNHLHW